MRFLFSVRCPLNVNQHKLKLELEFHINLSQSKKLRFPNVVKIFGSILIDFKVKNVKSLYTVTQY